MPDGDYAAFVAQQEPATARPDAIVDDEGEDARPARRRPSLHDRAAQGAGHLRPAPLYVLRIDAASGTVDRRPACRARALDVFTSSGVNWTSGAAPPGWRPWRADPHRHPAARPRAAPGRTAPRWSSTRRRLAVTPGQAAVFYDGDVVVGGGWID